MGLSKYKLGDLVELTDERNSMGRYSLEDVKGISTEKNFIETKANMYFKLFSKKRRLIANMIIEIQDSKAIKKKL